VADVFLIELTHPNVPLQRLLVEANGPAAARKAYLEKVASVRPVSASEALKLARDGVPMLDASPPEF
jgi:hypothetical protein